MSKKEEMLKLKSSGYSIKEIAKIHNCSMSLVTYYCYDKVKSKMLDRTRKYRKNHKRHPYDIKKHCFCKIILNKKTKSNNSNLNQINKKLYKFQKDNTMDKFTVQDVKDKLGEHPVCYLTGEQIDINKPNTYQFDHIIPRSRGGQSTLDNLGICTKRANLSKSDMTPDEFFNFCKIVLENQGYKVTKD